MAKWIATAVAVGLVLILVLWKLTAPPGEKHRNAVVPDAAVEPTGPTTMPTFKKRAVKKPQAKPSDGGIVLEKVEKLDPKSEEFNRRIDIGITDRLRAHAALCYKGGGNPDAKLKIFYRLRIENGKSWVTDVKLENHGIPDAIARCMVDNVERATWSSDDMPDFTTPENDREMLFVRLRALKKYKWRYKELRQ